MQTRSQLKHARISPQKLRLVADQIRGQSAEQALEILTFSEKKAGAILKKVVDSALANAEHNEGADIDELRISEVMVDAGPVMKRLQPRAKGRGNRILKRTSHVTVTVSDDS